MKNVIDEKIKLEVKLLSDAFMDIKLKSLFLGLDAGKRNNEKESKSSYLFNEAHSAWVFFEELSDKIALNQTSDFYGNMSLEEISKLAPYQMYKNILKNKEPKRFDLVQNLVNGNIKNILPKSDMERNDVSEKPYRKNSIPGKRKNLSNVLKKEYNDAYTDVLRLFESYFYLIDDNLPRWIKTQIKDLDFYLRRSEQADILGFNSIKNLKKYTDYDISKMIQDKAMAEMGEGLGLDDVLAELGIDVNIK